MIFRYFNKSCEIGNNAFIPTVFVDGCNFHCDYCMNSKLAKKQIEQNIQIEEILHFVKENDCKMIFLSGGEPFLNPIDELLEFIYKMSNVNCCVGICTNGYYDKKIDSIIPYLGYVALDIKTDAYRYKFVTDQKMAYEKVLNCADCLISEKGKQRANGLCFDYEFRTTLYPPLVDEKAIKKISHSIYKNEKWVWQQFRPTKNMFNPQALSVKPYNKDKIEKLRLIAKEYGHTVEIKDV